MGCTGFRETTSGGCRPPSPDLSDESTDTKDLISSNVSKIKLTKLQQWRLKSKAPHSFNEELAASGALAMRTRKQRLEKEKEQERQEWLENHRRESEEKRLEEEKERSKNEKPKVEKFVPCWELAPCRNPKSLQAGWLIRVLDGGAKRTLGVH
ncbi:hypothetical protein TWF694_009466 [Orbilia ellipsospora]|uniref:Uncharacterized protein n=1 Tax=Orbilia ellipsospora TaxID=2528407 RepID=A0AAV9XAX1_9PEZI